MTTNSLTQAGQNSNSLQLVGLTPLVKLNNVVPTNGANVYAKLECFNPGGSVKDRIAKAMVEDAEHRGILKPGSTIIEATSGNTGIGLAMVGAVKGYQVILVMSENMSAERRMILESFGAKTELSRAEFGMEGTIERAEELLAQNPDYFMPQQFNNPANPAIHKKTTGPEIISAMNGENVDAFVAGVGTGGTITGVGECIKQNYKDIGDAARRYIATQTDLNAIGKEVNETEDENKVVLQVIRDNTKTVVVDVD